MSRGPTLLPIIVSTVLALSACGGEETAPNGGQDGAGATLGVLGTNELQFQPSQLTADAGSVEVELTAEETVPHTFVVEDANGDVEVADAPAGQTDTGSIQLEPGEFTFYCSVPGHREAGMEGTLTVE